MPVTEIGETDRATCDLAGTTIVFPDGFEVVAPALGGRTATAERHRDGSESDTYSLANLGIYGIVAAQTAADPKHTDWWGIAEGISKEKLAFGSHDGN
ncbi:hypothetical protein EV379_1785 [Microterricola gilva]|uniref:Uncharacterized protein n=1 Tax=Microterricola gilva TaxID=393267 RepID=A0A4Q8AMU9_9MICO|nr:hypothetical protein EV379_1785 [Microterricola gilva]